MSHETTESTTLEIKGSFTLVAANPSVVEPLHDLHEQNPFNRSWGANFPLLGATRDRLALPNRLLSATAYAPL